MLCRLCRCCLCGRLCWFGVLLMCSRVLVSVGGMGVVVVVVCWCRVFISF